jgi:hypothetical protein
MLSSRLLPSRSVHRIIVRSFLAVEPEKIEYVHPLSQIVLEHLESTQSKFVTAHGLDRGLRLQRDGTFEIRFPSYEIDRARIWTSFDKEEKKHWLNCHKGDLVGRYMLQDNKKPAWHSDSKSTPEKICDAVDAMIERINAEEPHTK